MPAADRISLVPRSLGHIYVLTGDQNVKTRFDNNRSGYRLSTSVGGSVTGEGGDRIVCDDPHKVDEAESDTVRKAALDWWDLVMSTRGNDPKTSSMVVVMQRCRQRDLSGHLLERGGWEHLCLPAEYEGTKCITSIGWSDPREQIGELLWPDRFGPTEIETLKTSLGSYAAAGQLQQRPSPAGGGLFKRHWFRFFQGRGMNLPPVMVRMPDGSYTSVAAIEAPRQVDEQIQSWDCALKDLDTSDYVVGLLVAARSFGLASARVGASHLCPILGPARSFPRTLGLCRFHSRLAGILRLDYVLAHWFSLPRLLRGHHIHHSGREKQKVESAVLAIRRADGQMGYMSAIGTDGPFLWTRQNASPREVDQSVAV